MILSRDTWKNFAICSKNAKSGREVVKINLL
nr:MAG TPA: hypothetical protein [Caudoviricetes sp.]DAZ72629.1 MAG TPA: hypothetical protein [Caudoviricetes sp.]